MKNRIFLTLVVLVLMTIVASSQCAMCKASVESSTRNGANVGGGLNNAILYLMAAPYLLLIIFFRKKIWGFLKGIRSQQNG